MRILLAEDERSLSRAVVALLEKNNYSADAVYDGAEALEYLAAENYDAVILDIMMPKMDGLTVLRKLRDRGSHVPVLMLTAKSEVEDKVAGLDTGANDYLTKPFATAELLARIRAMTRTQNTQTDSRLSFGNVVLDQTTFELSAPGGSSSGKPGPPAPRLPGWPGARGRGPASPPKRSPWGRPPRQ